VFVVVYQCHGSDSTDEFNLKVIAVKFSLKADLFVSNIALTVPHYHYMENGTIMVLTFIWNYGMHCR